VKETWSEGVLWLAGALLAVGVEVGLPEEVSSSTQSECVKEIGELNWWGPVLGKGDLIRLRNPCGRIKPLSRDASVHSPHINRDCSASRHVDDADASVGSCRIGQVIIRPNGAGTSEGPTAGGDKCVRLIGKQLPPCNKIEERFSNVELAKRPAICRLFLQRVILAGWISITANSGL
jgi:hypothetical protein